MLSSNPTSISVSGISTVSTTWCKISFPELLLSYHVECCAPYVALVGRCSASGWTFNAPEDDPGRALQGRIDETTCQAIRQILPPSLRMWQPSTWGKGYTK
jgi:hypothetical protein